LQELDVRVRVPHGTPAKMITCVFKKKHLTFGIKVRPCVVLSIGYLFIYY